METPKFIAPIVNAIGDISITEALDSIDREFARLAMPTEEQVAAIEANAAQRITALEASVIRLRKALTCYADPNNGWEEVEHADAYEESRELVPDDAEEREETLEELRRLEERPRCD